MAIFVHTFWFPKMMKNVAKIWRLWPFWRFCGHFGDFVAKNGAFVNILKVSFFPIFIVLWMKSVISFKKLEKKRKKYSQYSQYSHFFSPLPGEIRDFKKQKKINFWNFFFKRFFDPLVSPDFEYFFS
jgi:hypothetical protein